MYKCTNSTKTKYKRFKFSLYFYNKTNIFLKIDDELSSISQNYIYKFQTNVYKYCLLHENNFILRVPSFQDRP